MLSIHVPEKVNVGVNASTRTRCNQNPGRAKSDAEIFLARASGQ